jgi:hypothetical protein
MNSNKYFLLYQWVVILSGLDGILLEALKVDIDTNVKMIHPLFTKIWEEETVLEDIYM